MSMKPNPFTHSDYVITERELAYKGLFSYYNYHVKHRLFNNEWSKDLKLELVERRNASAILPYDPILDQVVLISQFRPGPLAPINGPTNPWLVEIVAGVIGDGETPKDVAVREVAEEAGCQVLDLYFINDYFVSPGGSSEYLHLYCGRIDATVVGAFGGLHDENEDIACFVLDAEEAFELLRQGKIKTSPAIIALQWLQINRSFIRDLWLKKS